MAASSQASGNRPVLYLIDGHSLAYRAYHAFARGREPLATSTGEVVSAVFGFTRNMMDILEKEQPRYIAVTFDDGLSGRGEVYADYKAQRPDAPDDFEPQIQRIKQVVRAFNIPVLTLPGYEADDVIGTIAAQAEAQAVDVCIFSGDYDILQLLSPHTKVHIRTRRKNDSGKMVTVDIFYDEARFEEEYGFPPKTLIDYKALRGDSSDNVPGVKGIGDKGATDLLQTYQSLENLYDHLDEIKGANKKKLDAGRESAFMSKQLVTIQRDVPIQLDLAACEASDFDRTQVEALFRELEFTTLFGQLDKLAPAPPAQLSLFDLPPDEAQTTEPLVETIIVHDEATLAALVETLNNADAIAFDTETTSTDQMAAELVGISLAVDGTRGYYIPVGHREGQQLDLDTVLDALRPALTNPDIAKYAHNANYDLVVMQRYGVDVAPITFDTMIAEWVRNPASNNLGLKNLVLLRLRERMTEISDLIGSGKNQTTMDTIAIEQTAPYAAADAALTWQLVEQGRIDDGLVEQGLRWELQQADLLHLFETLEMPLVPVIAAMERAGVLLDRNFLAEVSADLTAQLDELEARIRMDAHKDDLNINSPQQLSDILFGKLGLPVEGIKRTAYGYSTAAHVLENLRADHPHPILDKLLRYRELSKLKGTYVDALPELINPRTGRVHTSFNQTGTTTGRLSSSNPNLQNIPIRTEQGRAVRQAFIAPPGSVLLGVDYSQVELRIMAHISREPALLEAFAQDRDIHAATASLVYGIALDAVTKEQRNFAKRVNFGTLYGMGAFRLARDSDLTLAEAREFIDTYFERLPNVRRVIEATKQRARSQGYVETLFGRRRYFPVLKASGGGRGQQVQAAEREAINMPIQGTAADVIKIAMIDLHREIQQQGLKARMILQVHDELVLEVPESELEATARLVVAVMERVTLPDGSPFEPRLRANAAYGFNWRDMQNIE